MEKEAMFEKVKGELSNFQKNRSSLAFALVLLLAVSGVIAVTPISSAQSSTPTVATDAYLAVSPNPVGVNQEVALLMWLVQIEPTASVGHGGRWENLTILVSKPDGTTQTLGPFTADDASYAYGVYYPDTTGTYNLQFNFPGKHVTGNLGMNGAPIDAYYEASSFTATLVVQTEPVSASPQTPLPTEYWSRPVNAQNFDWSTISGNWLGTGAGQFGTQFYNATGNFNPYTVAPNNAHIVWSKPLEFGGLIGGEFGGSPTSNYYTGKTYESAFTPPVVINGVLYYNDPAAPKLGFYAVDLRTGETLWHQNSPSTITNGQVYNFLSPNQKGGIPYLWYTGVGSGSGAVSGSTWYMYDANTGNLLLQIANATLGTTTPQGGGNVIEGPNGELLVYVIGNNWLALWNSSRCILSSPGSSDWSWRPQAGATLDWSKGVQWNVTTQTYPSQSISYVNSGVILATTGVFTVPQNWQWEIGYDATTGAQLWAQNRTTPLGGTNWGLMGPVSNGIYVEFHSNTMQWYGYSVYTGEQVWGPSKAYENAWGSIANGNVFAQSAYGILYAGSVDGIHALNMTTGERLWDFYADASGADFPGFSTYPFENNELFTIADGKVFASTGVSHGVPIYRGSNLYAIDAFSGEPVWSINGFILDTMPVTDGYLIAFNCYDNQIYCFGKGLTATAVSAPSLPVASGQSVLIQGSVTDQSPGETCLGIPAAGTPAVSEDSMSAWMEYLYMQQPQPTDVTGVSVHLTAIDSNGNSHDLGYTTSNDLGNFATSWTPPVPGMYTVTAQFEGSESYYSSKAGTSFVVSEASASASVNPTVPTQPPAETASPAVPTPSLPSEAPEPTSSGSPTTTYIAVGVAVIVIVAAAAALAFRRRK